MVGTSRTEKIRWLLKRGLINIHEIHGLVGGPLKTVNNFVAETHDPLYSWDLSMWVIQEHSQDIADMLSTPKPEVEELFSFLYVEVMLGDPSCMSREYIKMPTMPVKGNIRMTSAEVIVREWRRGKGVRVLTGQAALAATKIWLYQKISLDLGITPDI
jgi:hypothetical protein